MNQKYQVTKKDAEGFTAPSPHTRYARILFDRETIPGAQMSLAIFRYEPGQIGPAHSHEEEAEVYFMLKGTAEVDLGDKTYELTPGSALYIPPRTGHETRNIGNEEMEFLAVFAPAMDFDDLREKWSENESA